MLRHTPKEYSQSVDTCCHLSPIFLRSRKFDDLALWLYIQNLNIQKMRFFTSKTRLFTIAFTVIISAKLFPLYDKNVCLTFFD